MKKVSEVKRNIAGEARKHAPLALATLAEICSDGDAPHSARVSAANALLDRGVGRPVQGVEHTGEDGGPVRHAHTINPQKLSSGAMAELLDAADADETSKPG
jgi:hypothetical protein